MIERGMLVAGHVVPGTDWCLRESEAWFNPGERGTRPRAIEVTCLVGHWTAGEAGAAYADDDGPRVVRVMKTRVKNGRPLNCGIHFVIGAPVLNGESFVWQTADPGFTATVHVGQGFVNAQSIGVEVVSAGLPGQANVRQREELDIYILGKKRRALRFYDAQLEAWLRLADTLASLNSMAGISIPRRVPAHVNRFTIGEARRWRGAMEHFHVPGTTKLDAGGMLVGALHGAGWDTAL